MGHSRQSLAADKELEVLPSNTRKAPDLWIEEQTSLNYSAVSSTDAERTFSSGPRSRDYIQLPLEAPAISAKQLFQVV